MHENQETAEDSVTAAEVAQLLPPRAGDLPTNSPRSLGRFEIIDVLGEGGFGIVYRAHDPQLDREVAVKVLRPGALGDEKHVARFLREARAAAQLRHPQIVPIYDAGKHGDTHYIASALIHPGLTLRDLLRKRTRLDVETAVSIVESLAGSLAYAHSLGIVHRDIKPDNILIDEAGGPHIADFGLARHDESTVVRTQEGSRLGTPAYMSPEQHAGMSHEADGRSDQWSLGIILYELLVGERPFLGNEWQLAYAVRESEPVELRKRDASIPRDLEIICLKCLSKDPSQRYDGCDLLAADLASWRKTEPLIARKVSFIGKSWRWARRNPMIATLLAAILAVTCLGVTGILIQWRESEFERARAEQFSKGQESQRRIAEARAADLEVLNAKLQKTNRQLNKAQSETSDALADLADARSQEEFSTIAWSHYVRSIKSAQVNLAILKTADARRQLESCYSPHRNWEWHHLIDRCSPWSPPSREYFRGFNSRNKVLTSLRSGQTIKVRGRRQVLAREVFYRSTFNVDPSGRYILSGDRLFGPDLRELGRLPAGFPPALQDGKFVGSFFSGNGKRLLLMKYAAGDVTAGKLYEIPSCRIIGSFEIAAVGRFALNHDGTQFAVTTKDSLSFWRLSGEGNQITCENQHTTETVSWVSFSPVGNLICTVSGDQLRLLDAKNFNVMHTLKPESGKGPFFQCSFSTDGTRLALAKNSGLGIWDIPVDGGKITRRIHWPSPAGWLSGQVAFSPDGRRVGCNMGGGATVWDIDAQPAQTEIVGAAGGCGTATLKGHTVVVARSLENGVERVGVWDATAGTITPIKSPPIDRQRGHEVVIPPATLGDPIFAVWKKSEQSVELWATSGLQFSIDNVALSAGSHPPVAFDVGARRVGVLRRDKRQGALRLAIFDCKSGTALHDLDVSVSVPRHFAIGEGWVAIDSAGGVRIKNLADSKEHLVENGGHAIHHMSFFNLGSVLATCANDGSIRIWHYLFGRGWVIWKTMHHIGASYVSISFDGTRLVSCGGSEIRLWDIPTAQTVLVLPGRRATFSMDGIHMVVETRQDREAGKIAVLHANALTE